MTAFPWERLLQAAAKQYQWTPETVLRGMPFGQLMMVFNVAQEEEMSMDDVKKAINERRIRNGQAPMKPAPRTRR